MTPKVTLRKALEDPALLGSVLGGDSWAAWRALLLAANGEPLNSGECEIFRKFTGRPEAPTKRVDELWCAIGRRSGKSRGMATMAAYYAGLCEHKLARGEKGVVLLIAQDNVLQKYRLIMLRAHWNRLRCLVSSSRNADARSLSFRMASSSRHALLHFVAFVVRPALRLSAMRLHSGDVTKAQTQTLRSYTLSARHLEHQAAR